MSDEERPIIDQDNPEWTEEDFASARPATLVHPPQIAALLVRKAGRPKGSVKSDAKQAVSLRLDREVFEDFRRDKPGWQSRINLVLRARAQMERLIEDNLAVIEAVEDGKLILRSGQSVDELKHRNQEMRALLSQGKVSIL